MPETCSAIEGVATFEGVYCSRCEKSTPGLVKTRCRCGNPLEPSTVQCLAYHWRECQQWFRVSTPKTPPAKHLSTADRASMIVEQLGSSKVQMLASYSYTMAHTPPPPSPILSQLGLDVFCQTMWKHATFPSIWKCIEQWPQAKVKLEQLVFRTAIKDFDQLSTSNSSLKQLVFSNRRSVATLPISDYMNLTCLSLPAQLEQT